MKSTILIVGAADTGRAPMAAALLRRLLAARGIGWDVASAGVLGHDGAEAEVEARDTMVHMGLDVGGHRARLLDEAMVESSALIIAIDSGTARVLGARYPAAQARVANLGELAGRTRDIPDPFRMQIGAWMTYAREIERMLEAAMPRIAELMPLADDQGRVTNDQRGSIAFSPTSSDFANDRDARTPRVEIPTDRLTTAARIGQLLRLAAQMPDVVDWSAARPRVDADLAAIAAAPAGPADLVAAYIGLLRAGLALLPASPSPAQLAALQQSVEQLGGPIGQSELNALSARIATLPALV